MNRYDITGGRIIFLGSDHAGFQLKEFLKASLLEAGYAVNDLGIRSEESCDYPDIALAVAEAVSMSETARGVLVCGTGAGMAIAANKVPGVRAAACNELYTAKYCRAHNDANVITVGSRILSAQEAMNACKVFLETDFDGDDAPGARHLRRLEKIREIERKYGRES
ncbi:MAG: ribose 5-phosphate isomerase B [Candidatus Anoxymicrobium japonicum]|uniref:Ribose 5-phosphate isomerase B n=1 Tax=Candidatus Anoxymicrobium japonicum TaxID=2013648 RepID=A0A2N3G551_9ACTN|nr:MAG: ribose 5-phosphate isomerase B [Candidatus Anoxymicrobium japonicum]